MKNECLTHRLFLWLLPAVGGEERADRSSPAVRCGLSAASSVDVAPVYEDDFVSSRSSGGGSSLSKKGYNGCR